jgi:hypothetical protein
MTSRRRMIHLPRRGADSSRSGWRCPEAELNIPEAAAGCSRSRRKQRITLPRVSVPQPSGMDRRNLTPASTVGLHTKEANMAGSGGQRLFVAGQRTSRSPDHEPQWPLTPPRTAPGITIWTGRCGLTSRPVHQIAPLCWTARLARPHISPEAQAHREEISGESTRRGFPIDKLRPVLCAAPSLGSCAASMSLLCYCQSAPCPLVAAGIVVDRVA